MSDQLTYVNDSKRLFIGMDLHKNTSTFVAKDKAGRQISYAKVLTDRNDVSRYINALKELSDRLSLAVEPVSQWYYYADLLEALGVDVHLAHPANVKAIASARIKTDKIDAGVLADLLRGDLLPEAYFSPREVRGWKEQCRFRASLINLRTQVKNKVHAILFKHSLRHNFTDLFGKGGRRWLAGLDLKEPFRGNLDKYLELVDRLTEQVVRAEEAITATVIDCPPASLLVSIPGIGYCSALTIMAEIGNIDRFISVKHLQSYAGLIPSTYNSGDKQIHGKITKRGSKWLRWIMIEAAYHQMNCKRIPGFGSYYNGIRMRKGSKTAAVATARKLLAVVWRLLKDKRPYEVTDPRCWKSRPIASNLSSVPAAVSAAVG
jgi:transposase